MSREILISYGVAVVECGSVEYGVAVCGVHQVGHPLLRMISKKQKLLTKLKLYLLQYELAFHGFIFLLWSLY